LRVLAQALKRRPNQLILEIVVLQLVVFTPNMSPV
jgi:hypothetical protein